MRRVESWKSKSFFYPKMAKCGSFFKAFDIPAYTGKFFKSKSAENAKKVFFDRVESSFFCYQRANFSDFSNTLVFLMRTIYETLFSVILKRKVFTRKCFHKKKNILQIC